MKVKDELEQKIRGWYEEFSHSNWPERTNTIVILRAIFYLAERIDKIEDATKEES